MATGVQLRVEVVFNGTSLVDVIALHAVIETILAFGRIKFALLADLCVLKTGLHGGIEVGAQGTSLEDQLAVVAGEVGLGIVGGITNSILAKNYQNVGKYLLGKIYILGRYCCQRYYENR